MVAVEGYDKARDPGAQRLCNGANAALVHDGRSAREYRSMRRVVEDRDAVWQRHGKSRSIRGLLADQEQCSSANSLCGRDARGVKLARGIHDRRTQREDDRCRSLCEISS